YFSAGDVKSASDSARTGNATALARGARAVVERNDLQRYEVREISQLLPRLGGYAPQWAPLHQRRPRSAHPGGWSDGNPHVPGRGWHGDWVIPKNGLHPRHRPTESGRYSGLLHRWYPGGLQPER